MTELCRKGRIDGARKEHGLWIIPDTAEKPLDGRTTEFADSRRTSGEGVSFSRSGSFSKVVGAFRDTYRKEPFSTAFTPYRICPVGAHVDHNLGRITGFAIDKGIHIAYGPKQNGVIEIKSLQFPKRAQWHVSSTPEIRQNDWADHLRGATIALNRRFPLRIGLCAVIDGELPIGGLSSSAAVIITFLSALSDLNGIKLTPEEMIGAALEAENKYVGVACGRLDQSCEIYCRKDHLLYLDFLDDSREIIPRSASMKDFKIGIFFSGHERTLAGSKFNMRVDELRSAAYALAAFSGAEYGKFSDTNMRDVPREVYESFKDRLPDNWRKRAEHWFTEFDRVGEAVEAWKKGDVAAFGRISSESGRSSIVNWETGSPELIKMYEILTHTDGVYGGRFSGAGFKGCCMALIDPAFAESASRKIEDEYLAAFPALRGKFSAHICDTADGVRL